MQVGETRQFNVVDNLGNPSGDVAWDISDTTLATDTTTLLGSSSSGTISITAIAPGSLTLTGTVEGVAAQSQITISPLGVVIPGTVLWSTPPQPGFVVQQLAQAVPTDNGPDVYSIQTNGTQTKIQALRTDGRQMWQATRPIANSHSVPDGEGGLITTENNTCLPGQTDPMALVDLDAKTGQPKWRLEAAGVSDPNAPNGISYCYPDTVKAFEPQIAVRGDGAVIIAAMTNNGLPPLTIMQDGQPISINIPTSTDTQPDGTPFDEFSPMGPPIVDTDGSTYLEYEVRQIAANPRRIASANLYLLKIAPDNSATPISLSSTTEDKNLLPGRVIPDGQGGILATWTVSPSTPPQWNPASPPHAYQASDVVGGVPSPAYDLPFTPKTISAGEYPTLVLGENATAFATGLTTTTDGTDQDRSQIAAFAVNSGTPAWSHQTTVDNPTTIVAATAGNGVVAKTTNTTGQDTISRFDSSGAAATPDSTPNLSKSSYSWRGDLNGLVNGVPAAMAIAQIPISFLSTFAMPDGNSSANGKSVVNHTIGIYWCGTGVGRDGACDHTNKREDINFYYLSGGTHDFSTDHPEWISLIKQAATDSLVKAFNGYARIQKATFTNGSNDQDFRIYISGYVSQFSGESINSEVSNVYYGGAESGARTALSQWSADGSHTIATFSSTHPYPPTAATMGEFQALMVAIGKGIGNGAGHEMSHHFELNNGPGFLFPNVDCGLGNSPGNGSTTPTECPSDVQGISDDYVYNFWLANGEPADTSAQRLNTTYTPPISYWYNGGQFFFKDVPNFPIHWATRGKCWLTKWSATWWQRTFGSTCP
jgi:hypothetical protein